MQNKLVSRNTPLSHRPSQSLVTEIPNIFLEKQMRKQTSLLNRAIEQRKQDQLLQSSIRLIEKKLLLKKLQKPPKSIRITPYQQRERLRLSYLRSISKAIAKPKVDLSLLTKKQLIIVRNKKISSLDILPKLQISICSTDI